MLKPPRSPPPLLAIAALFVVAALALLAWLLAAPSNADSAAQAGAPTSPLLATVVAVGDGDSASVRDAQQRTHRVRLHGTDAPEREQAGGAQAHAHLQALLLGREVEVRFQKIDRHGRILGTIFLQGENVNLRLVQDGLAWHYPFSARELGRDATQALAAAQRQAQGQQRGLWAQAQPQPPWEYRRQQRDAR